MTFSYNYTCHYIIDVQNVVQLISHHQTPPYFSRYGLREMELFYLLNVFSLASVVGFAGWLVVVVLRPSSPRVPVVSEP